MARGRQTPAHGPAAITHGGSGEASVASLLASLRAEAVRVRRDGTPEAWAGAGAALDAVMASSSPAKVLGRLAQTPDLETLLPDIAIQVGFDQRSPYHPEGDLFVHTHGVLERISALTDDPDLRWAALLHDSGKPESFWLDDKGVGHFYQSRTSGTENHEVVSARIARRVLAAFAIAPDRARRIERIVRSHMRLRFETEKAARRFIDKVGPDLVEPLLIHRQADHEGEGSAEDSIGRMRALIAKASSPAPAAAKGGLSVDGAALRGIGITGPRIGEVIATLRSEVSSGSLVNEREALLTRARSLS